MRFQKTGCLSKATISQRAVVTSFAEGSRTRNWLEGLGDDQWTITSFDFSSRVVCFEVVADSGDLRFFSIALHNW